MNRLNEIKHLHNKIVSSLRRSLPDAIRAGQLLTEEKAELGHGEWEKWVRGQQLFSVATARNYMKLYKNQERFKTLRVSGLADAYKLLYASKAKPKPKPKPKGADDKPKRRELRLDLTPDEDKELKDLLVWLGEKLFQSKTTKEIIFEALRHARGGRSWPRKSA